LDSLALFSPQVRKCDVVRATAGGEIRSHIRIAHTILFEIPVVSINGLFPAYPETARPWVQTASDSHQDWRVAGLVHER
jgi:hypothetical protein